MLLTCVVGLTLLVFIGLNFGLLVDLHLCVFALVVLCGLVIVTGFCLRRCLCVLLFAVLWRLGLWVGVLGFIYFGWYLLVVCCVFYLVYVLLLGFGFAFGCSLFDFVLHGLAASEASLWA